MSFWDSLDRRFPRRTFAGAALLASALARPAPPPAIESDVVAWARASLGFSPDEVQCRILRSPASRLMLCCTRQFGKSTVTAIKALHYAWTHSGSLVLVAAPTARQSGEWLLKIRSIVTRLGTRARSDGNNRLSLLLPNLSRIVALPNAAENIVGFSKAALLIVDEAALVPDAVFRALNPMLAVSHGSLWLISTAGDQSGFFYEEWSRQPAAPLDPSSASAAAPSPGTVPLPPAALASVAWERYRVTADQCPRILPEFLAEQRLLLGDAVFRAQYLCEFVAAGAQLIARNLLDAALDDDMLPFNGGKPLWPW